MKILADRNIPFVAEYFSSIGNVQTIAGRDITAKALTEIDILLIRSVTKVTASLLANSNVRFIATATIGIDHIDRQYLSQKNIGFASAPGSNANSVAEYIVAALLNIAQKNNITLHEKSIGVIGAGNVGSKVAQKCAALGMNVLLNDPPLRRETNDSKYLPIEKLFDCDFITIHTPLTHQGQDKTFHLANEKFFNSLKDGCTFINTSRGAVADTNAIKNAITAGKLKASVLDVWENEPNIDTELLEMTDIATPHIAGYSYDGKVAGMIMIYKAACEHFNLTPKFDTVDFLPAPPLPQLQINAQPNQQQKVLLETVEKIYDIKSDDAGLRDVLKTPADERGKFFTQLRKNYPIRREFQNTTTISSDSKLNEILTGIGFKI
ncbi:4-phosphoerythronate dehydrogenase [Planctomycetota bacterium]